MTGPIDALAPLSDRAYRDGLVEVVLEGPVPARRDLHTVRTPHFDVRRTGAGIRVLHRVPPDQVDDDLAVLINAELFATGWLRGEDLFERIFTGIVLTSGPDPLASWTNFYGNTLDRISECLVAPPGCGGHGTIAGFAPVYARAESLLLPGSVLELGSCFGFLSLRIAASGRAVTATDMNPGTVALLRAVAPNLGVTLGTGVADASRVPAPDGVADNVLLIHLLEHLEADYGAQALAEAVRLARRRIVVAVPLEDEADETWGHVRTISLADLDQWGAATGLSYEVHEHHGGWLVLDNGSAGRSTAVR